MSEPPGDKGPDAFDRTGERLPQDTRARRVSRRMFIGTGALAATGSVAAACVNRHPDAIPDQYDTSDPARTPLPPSTAPPHGVYAFFSEPEATTVEAITARIIPGDADDPGAREAGVANYIDGKLAQFDAFAEPTYRAAPFAEAYEGDSPPGEDTDEVIYVHDDELFRYGHQLQTTPHEVYRDGLAGLDLYSEQRFGAPFRDLDEDQQDAVLVVLDEIQQRSELTSEEQEDVDEPTDARTEDEDTDAGIDEEIASAEEAFDDLDPGTFFQTVWADTIEGMFSDPMYGGNRDLVGWSMIGYPGAQRSYSPQEMKDGTTKRPQSLDGLRAMNPDHPDQHAPPALERYREGVVEK